MARLRLTEQDRIQLRRWLHGHATPARLRLRARVVLALADALSDRAVARELGVARQTVALWRTRVSQTQGVETLVNDAPGRGRKPLVPTHLRATVLEAWRAGQTNGAPSSVRALARRFGLSPATVHRVIRRARAQAVGATGQEAPEVADADVTPAA